VVRSVRTSGLEIYGVAEGLDGQNVVDSYGQIVHLVEGVGLNGTQFVRLEDNFSSSSKRLANPSFCG
jgi:hypothetical protein